MTIVQQPDAPTNAVEIIGQALQDLERLPPDDLGGSGVDLAPEPLPVYFLGLDSLSAQGEVLSRAVRQGWRYLLQGAEENTFYADLVGGQTSARFSSLSTDEGADALLEAAAQAQQFADTISDDVEVRVLEVPSVRIAALWLVGEVDRFIPYIDGAGVPSMRGRVLDQSEFLQGMRTRIPAAPKLGLRQDLDEFGG